MGVPEILEALKAERERMDAAISALEQLEGSGAGGGAGAAKTDRRYGKGKRHMSADARRRIGKAMREAWAKRKAAAHRPGRKSKVVPASALAEVKAKAKGGWRSAANKKLKAGKKLGRPAKTAKKAVVGKRVFSAKARAAISKAAKERWRRAKAENPGAKKLGGQTAKSVAQIAAGA